MIPTRDRWDLAQRAVDSALTQKHVDAEVIVIDDASSTSMPTAAPFDDSRIHLERSTRPRGVAAARNLGASLASGIWIAFLDDDDVWAPRRLERLVEVAAREGVSWACSDGILVNGAFEPLAAQPAPPAGRLSAELRAGNAVPGGGSGVIVSRQLFADASGFDTRFSYLADWDLWLRLAARSAIAVVPETLVAYVAHSRAWSLRNDAAIHRDFDLLREIHPEVTATRAEYLEHIAFRQHVLGMRMAATRSYLSIALRHQRARSLAAAVRAAAGPRLGRRLRWDAQIPPLPPWLQA